MTPGMNPKADYLKDKQDKEQMRDSLAEKYNTRLIADSALVQTLLTRTENLDEKVARGTSNNYQVSRD